MSRQASGFGAIVLLVVVALVLWLAARHWRAVAPSAAAVVRSDGGVRSAGTASEEALRRGALPDLHEMGAVTDDHATRTQEALQQID